MKDLVIKVSKIFKDNNIQSILIGALARDIYFEKNNIKLEVRTKDVDFAVLLESWDEFESVKDILKKELQVVDVPNKPFRLMYGQIPVDILPFGKIAEPGETVNWPSQFRARMKVIGFKEALKNAATIKLDGHELKIIIPEMLVALKIHSWNSSNTRTKDAVDVRLILENVKTLCPDLDSDFFNDENKNLLDKYSTDEDGLWISVLGTRIQTLLKDSDLSFQLKNAMSSDVVVGSLIVDMNSGNIPDTESKAALEKLIQPLRDGLTQEFGISPGTQSS